MKDFSDMDANFKLKSDQIPVFEYERKMEQTNPDPEIHTNIIKNPPAAISTIPIPNPQPAEELSSSSSSSPPPIPSDQASPDDITTTNPIQEPKEKEKQEEDEPHQQVTNVPSPPRYQRKELGDGPYWQKPKESMITTQDEEGNTIKQSSCI